MKRHRKPDLQVTGIKVPYFNWDRELAIYTALWGRRLSRAQWQLLDEDVLFTSYSQWEKYTRRIYAKLEVEQLKEFSKYLEQQKSNKEILVGIEKSFLAIIISLFMSYFFAISLGDKVLFSNIELKIMSMMPLIAYNALFIICIVLTGFF